MVLAGDPFVALYFYGLEWGLAKRACAAPLVVVGRAHCSGGQPTPLAFRMAFKAPSMVIRGEFRLKRTCSS